MSTQDTTRAQVITEFGGPDRLHAAELPLRVPGPGELQVAVAAAAVNPVDLTTRAGLNIAASEARFPMVLGWDLAGTIARIGPDAGSSGDGGGRWAVGDRVSAMTFQPIDQNGTYAGHVNLSADLVARVPGGLSLEAAATIPLAGLTATQLLAALDQPAGASLVVNAPLGAVGRFVVQLAARAGLRVIAVVKPDEAPQALALGAQVTVARGAFAASVRVHEPAGADAALDLVGGDAAHQAIGGVRDGGRYATSVPPYIDAGGAFEETRGISPHVHTVHPDVDQLRSLLTAAAQGDIAAPVERAYPLSQAAEAHRHHARGGLRGKLVLIP